MMLGNQLETASLGMLSISILGAVCLVVTRSPVLGEKHHVMTKSRASRWLVSPVSAIKKRIRAWMFLIHGPSIIQEEFDKVIDYPPPLTILPACLLETNLRTRPARASHSTSMSRRTATLWSPRGSTSRRSMRPLTRSSPFRAQQRRSSSLSTPCRASTGSTSEASRAHR